MGFRDRRRGSRCSSALLLGWFELFTYHPPHPSLHLPRLAGVEVAQGAQFLHSSVHTGVVVLAFPGEVEVSALIVEACERTLWDVSVFGDLQTKTIQMSGVTYSPPYSLVQFGFTGAMYSFLQESPSRHC